MSRQAPAVVDRLSSYQTWSLAIGLLGVLALGLSSMMDRSVFFQAYLLGYFFWIGLSLGCLALTLLHDLSGGMWGALILRFVEAGMSTLPIMGLVFIPLLFGLPDLYLWTHPEQVAKDAVLQQQSVYLNVPFFVARAAFYFLTWIVSAYYLRRWSLDRDHAAVPRIYTGRLRWLGAGGLILFGFTSSFAAIDWVMSLEPRWSSTIYPAMVVLGGVLAGFALTVFFAALLRDCTPLSDVISRGLFNDLGSLMLMFVILWTYFSFSQFLIIYSGNTNEEIPWYIHRLADGWIWVAWAVALLEFFLPFALLIFRDLKRNARILAGIALLLVFAHFVEVYWLIIPAFHPDGFYIHWLYVAAPIAMGGIWIAVFAWNLKGQPLIPQHDRRFIENALAERAKEQLSPEA